MYQLGYNVVNLRKTSRQREELGQRTQNLVRGNEMFKILRLVISRLNPSRYAFVVFSYLLNFCRQWLLCRFFSLGDLSTHLFGLVFPCHTSEEMMVWVHRTPLSSIKVGFFKALFSKKLFKHVVQALFIYVCTYTSTGTL